MSTVVEWIWIINKWIVHDGVWTINRSIWHCILHSEWSGWLGMIRLIEYKCKSTTISQDWEGM